MMRLDKRVHMALTCAGVLTALVLSIGKPAPVPASIEPEPGLPEEARPAVDRPPSWVRRGTHLLVGGKWLLNPKDGGFAELPYVMARLRADGVLDSLNFSLSPSGESIVLWDEHEFLFGPVRGPLHGPRPNPAFKRGDTEQERTVDTIRHIWFWNSEQQLVLYQAEVNSGTHASCHTYETGSHEWNGPRDCPEGDFSEVARIEPGADGWVVVISGAEGFWALSVYMSDPQRAPEGARAPRYVSSWGQLRAYVSLEGERVDLVTSCVLLSLEEADCEGRGEEEPWRLYTWRSGEEHLELVSERLPPNAVPAPVGRQVAWMEGEQVCVAEVEALERARCFCLPGHACSAQPAGR
jgi:hypothetical protein